MVVCVCVCPQGLTYCTTQKWIIRGIENEQSDTLSSNIGNFVPPFVASEGR